MRLTAVSFERYRAFKDKVKLDLSAVNLLIGKNGSGKSVISRLPLLLATALSSNPNGPLDLSAGEVDHGASFLDLVNDRSSLPFTLGAEIGDGHSVLSFETSLRYVAEKRALAIEKFSLRRRGLPDLVFELSSSEELASAAPTYILIGQGGAAAVPFHLKFSGIFPTGEGAPAGLVSQLAEALHAFRLALPQPSYLGPFRAEPERALRTPSQAIARLGPRGEHAMDLLTDDRLRHGGELAKAVGDWFSSAMQQEVDVDVTGEQPKITVGSTYKAQLSDTGAGFSQAIPVVVQNFAYRMKRIASPLLIVEQPELHLHPAAHGALADLFSETAKAGATCVIETHSEQFIMRLRRRIAEGLSPASVKLLSLGHADSVEMSPEVLRVIDFDDQGNPNAWPVGVFEEALDDLAAMRGANRERRK